MTLEKEENCNGFTSNEVTSASSNKQGLKILTEATELVRVHHKSEFKTIVHVFNNKKPFPHLSLNFHQIVLT